MAGYVETMTPDLPADIAIPSFAELPKQKMRMKQEIGVLEGVAIILGIILGSGIFISPGGVMQYAGSVGFTLTIWALCGMLSMIGAVCYAELGTSITKSGGDYAYINESFGSLLAFLFLWDAVVVFVPTTNAIMGLTFANYIVRPFFPTCPSPDLAVRLLAAVIITFLTYVNCLDMRITTRAQNIFMFTKVGAISVIIAMGAFILLLHTPEHFNNMWEGTITDPGEVAVAVYSGIFSYSGWTYLNFMTEELKDPYVNLPRAIYISVPLVTAVYVFANVAYLSVLSPQEIKESSAIAVTFGSYLFGSFSWIMSIMVAISAAGSLSVHIMTSARMTFVGARNGHCPRVLSFINVNKYTPIPSLVFMNILSVIMLCTSDVYVLITYSSFVESFFIMLSVSSLLYLRWKRPDLNRPIKVPIFFPVAFVIIGIFLVILPCYVKPYEVGAGVLITLLGIPMYLIFVKYKNKPRCFIKVLCYLTEVTQALLMSAKEEDEDE